MLGAMMVKEVVERNKKLYRCEECGFHYAERHWAMQCEQWCKEHRSCNIIITKHAVQRQT